MLKQFLSGFEPFIATRYLKSRRKEVFISIITVISVIGVAVSVMVLDIVLSVMTGFEAELKTKLLDANAHVIVREYGRDIERWSEVTDKIMKVPGVVAAYPYTYSQALLSTPQGAQGILIRGIPETPVTLGKLNKTMEEGISAAQLFTPAMVDVTRPDNSIDQVQLPPIILGRALRNRLALIPGNPLTLFSPQMSSSPQGMIPKLKRFVFVGSYSSGLMEYESGLGYMSLTDAQNFFGLGTRVTGIEVQVADLNQAADIASLIVQKLGGPESNFYATDWTQPNKPLWDAIKLEKRVYFIVLLLLILVASFSIISTLVMIVMEKSKDIAILKSMGASDRSVLKIFLLQGMIIGAAGTVLGTIMGYLGALGLREFGFKIDKTVFSLDRVPVHLIPANFIVVAIAGFIITALAGIYPARRAAKLNPASALRFD